MAEPRPWSLRSRVALAAALGAVLVAVVGGVVVGALLSHREIAGLDRRLDAVMAVAQTRLSSGSDPAVLLGPGRRGLLPATVGGLVVTVRSDTGTRTAGLTARPPELPPVDGAVTAGRTDYRVRTATLSDGGTVTVGLPATATDRTVAQVRKVTVLVTALAALAAAGLGWLLAGPATRPLRELRDRTALLGGRPGPADRVALASGSVARTAETAEVADAVSGLLHRVELARGESERALLSARDFAAAAEHELRTPLTAMRTDLEVLTAHPDLPAPERAEVLAQLVARQLRVEDILAALARLAAGDLAEPDRSPVELTDLVAQAVATAARTAPEGTAVEAVLPDAEITVPGSAAGLRLAVDNLLANSVRHAGARRIEAAVRADGDRVLITVDDDGAGVPPDERAAVFDRFRRGRAAHGPGS
ncbi:MAG TPA: HAMP domain-containing sensor histidine kinase, partial [Blastococcus sp.]|nr:HAMP domain-containing sensor histidine kinase [Blastococcus sp.]